MPSFFIDEALNSGFDKGRPENEKRPTFRLVFLFGADDEARTRYLHLGKVALYQMS